MLWNCQHILISCNLYVIFREMRVAFPHPHPLPHRPSFRKPLTILPYLVITFNFLILPYLCLSPYLLRLQTATAPLWQLESGPLSTSKVDENLKLHKDDDHSGKCAPVWHDDMYDHRRRRLFALYPIQFYTGGEEEDAAIEDTLMWKFTNGRHRNIWINMKHFHRAPL